MPKYRVSFEQIHNIVAKGFVDVVADSEGEAKCQAEAISMEGDITFENFYRELDHENTISVEEIK